MTLDQLAERVTAILCQARCAEAVRMRRIVLANVERLELERELATHIRYLQIAPIPDPDDSWDFAMLGGEYRHTDGQRDFDGRRGGDTEFTVNFIIGWLVDLADWSTLLPFERQT